MGVPGWIRKKNPKIYFIKVQVPSGNFISPGSISLESLRLKIVNYGIDIPADCGYK
jgi:hypothetical protein